MWGHLGAAALALVLMLVLVVGAGARAVLAPPYDACRVAAVQTFELVSEGRNASAPQRVLAHGGAPVQLVDSDAVSLSCVDARTAHNVVSTPGGDVVEFMLGLHVFLDQCVLGPPLDFPAVLELLRAFVAVHATPQRPFYMHTDDANMVGLLHAMQASRFPRTRPDNAEAWFDRLLDNSTRYHGCGHVWYILNDPVKYKFPPSIPRNVLRAFFELLWDPDFTPRMRLEVVHEDMRAQGIAVVSTRSVDPICDDRTVMLSPRIQLAGNGAADDALDFRLPNENGTFIVSPPPPGDVFVYHQTAVERHRSKVITEFFLGKCTMNNNNPQPTRDVFASQIRYFAEMQMDYTLETLGGNNLPLYQIEVEMSSSAGSDPTPPNTNNDTNNNGTNGGGSFDDGTTTRVAVVTILVLIFSLLIIICVGLAISLLVLDVPGLESLKQSSDERMQLYAGRLLPLVKRRGVLGVAFAMALAMLNSAIVVLLSWVIPSPLLVFVLGTAILLLNMDLFPFLFFRNPITDAYHTRYVTYAFLLVLGVLAFPVTKLFEIALPPPEEHGRTEGGRAGGGDVLRAREEFEKAVEMHRLFERGDTPGSAAGARSSARGLTLMRFRHERVQDIMYSITQTDIRVSAADRPDAKTIRGLREQSHRRKCCIVHEPGNIRKACGFILMSDLHAVDADAAHAGNMTFLDIAAQFHRIPVFLSGETSLAQALQTFQERHSQFAIVEETNRNSAEEEEPNEGLGSLDEAEVVNTVGLLQLEDILNDVVIHSLEHATSRQLNEFTRQLARGTSSVFAPLSGDDDHKLVPPGAPPPPLVALSRNLDRVFVQLRNHISRMLVEGMSSSSSSTGSTTPWRVHVAGDVELGLDDSPPYKGWYGARSQHHPYRAVFDTQLTRDVAVVPSSSPLPPWGSYMGLTRRFKCSTRDEMRGEKHPDDDVDDSDDVNSARPQQSHDDNVV